jgi:hypothetical protein
MPATPAPASTHGARITASRRAAASGRPGRPEPGVRPVPFRTADEAWLWTMAALTARRDGARYTANKGKVIRPCDPDDVIKCLDTLYRRRRIDLVHARVLRTWGDRQMAPPRHESERNDYRVWREAMERLEGLLRIKGIVE